MATNYRFDTYGLPIVMSVVGDTYVDSCRIGGILWEGNTTAGDQAEIVTRDSGLRIWKGRANDTQTYLGMGFGQYGVPAPKGFRLAVLGAGSVTIYLLEV